MTVPFFGRSGKAVGLSAISFSAVLQKDAAPIPNAVGVENWKLKTENWKLIFHFQLSTFNSKKLLTNKAMTYPTFVSP